MTYFTIFHWLAFAVFAAIYIGVLFVLIRKVRGQFLVVGVIVLSLAVPSIAMMVSLSLDKSLKKAKVVDLENKRNLRSEKIVFSGTIVNTGNYTIGEATYIIKLINKGHAAGNVKGSDFYQPNSFLDMVLSLGSGSKRKAKPNSIEIERVIAVNLKPKERKTFRVNVVFPSYFKNVLSREKLILH